MIALFLIGCIDTVHFPPSFYNDSGRDSGVPTLGDTGKEPEPPVAESLHIDVATVVCDAEAEWVGDVLTTGWTSAGA